MQFLRLPEVTRRVGLRKTCIYALIAKGDFPAQIKLGTRASAWLESEIDAWMRGRVGAVAEPAGEGE